MASKRKKDKPQPMTEETLVRAEQYRGLSDEDVARSRQMEARIDTAEKQGKKPRELKGEALVRAMVANEKLVRETNEAMREAREGKPGKRLSASDIEAWLDDPFRPRPI